jgi:phage tail sheath gpL-like
MYKSEIKEFNNYLDLLRSKIYDIRARIIQRDEIVIAQKIKNEFLGLGKCSKTVNEVFDYHNQRINELVDQEYSNSTYKRYVTTQKHVNDFLIYRSHPSLFLLVNSLRLFFTLWFNH